MSRDLTDNEQLKRICEDLLANVAPTQGNQQWVDNVLSWMNDIANMSREAFIDPAFQLSLWESEAVTTTGSGSVKIAAAANDPLIAALLWTLRCDYQASLAEDSHQRSAMLHESWNEILHQATERTGRTPRLKLSRIFTLLCPGAFSTVAAYRSLSELAKALGIKHHNASLVHLQEDVLERLAEVLGPIAEPRSEEGVKRLTLPWLLVEELRSADSEATQVRSASGVLQLNPLAPERRRRGMLPIAGGLGAIRSMIEFVGDGCSREDFTVHLQTLNPKAKPDAPRGLIYALIAEWDVIKAVPGGLELTARGEALLESGDPDEVQDWMLTRILGFDFLLCKLAETAMSRRQAIDALKTLNSAWNSDGRPSALISWMPKLQLVDFTGKKMQLSERGRQWKELVTWTPLALPSDADPVDLTEFMVDEDEVEDVAEERPSLTQIIERFDPQLSFPATLIAQLDAGLWSHPRRHFAVLTGLSGAGKTQLARNYGLSLWNDRQAAKQGTLIVPVQPGWHDDSSLLGYVNPLDTDHYVRTPALEFLLQAASDPSRPYTLVLDEMNLAHPEQYMAALLSAMETGDAIVLHNEPDELGGVPDRLPYPSNLLLIGTVNMDETTHGLSDKVLDRAAVIEFWDIDVQAYPGWSQSRLGSEQVSRVRTVVTELAQLLRPVRLHFGWRTLQAIIGYLEQTERGKLLTFDQALDQAIYSRILPKLRGEDSPRLTEVFDKLQRALLAARLPLCATKVGDMLDDLGHSGSARFWR
ncbi:McrB family protein [Pseudomonas putida]|uniref:McrB family protein n=1 Tax=Pseudomonas putida TaxID=303 RepID=UPI00383B8B24